jgi:hypothetical protein
MNHQRPNFSSIYSNFFRYNIYIIVGISLFILIIIQPYNGFCRSSKKCNPIVLKALIPAKLGERKLNINFQKSKNNNFEIKIRKKELSAITGTKIKNSIYLKNISNGDKQINLSYNLKNLPKNNLTKLDCPCLLNRNIK